MLNERTPKEQARWSITEERASLVSGSHSLSRFLVALSVSALALNWPWEMIQMSAYEEMAGRPWKTTVFTCTIASLGDAAITLAIYTAGALLTWRWRWPLYGKWKHYLMTALFGASLAVIIERVATASGRWTYNDSMPIVPELNVGLWPLLQLTLLVPLAIRLATWWVDRASGKASAR